MLPPWHPHFDVLAVVFALTLGYWLANTRLRPLLAPGQSGPTRRQWWQWYGGVLLLWIGAGWPIHDLAEESLFTLHMVEHMIMAFLVPPLLLMGTPRWLADATLGRPVVARVVRSLAHPVTAFFVFNITFIGLHWPVLVTWQVTSEPAHLVAHVGLFVTATLMWLPVLSPTPAIPKLSRPTQMLYLFLQSLLPTIPASFITFSSVPLYPVYGDAAVAFGLTAVSDQTISGIVMKLGGGLIIWITITVIWFRWTSGERDWERLEADLRTG